MKFSAKDTGFDKAFYDKMYTNFDANLNMYGQGGVVAAPDNVTQYWFHWMRDGALCMKTYMDINDNDF